MLFVKLTSLIAKLSELDILILPLGARHRDLRATKCAALLLPLGYMAKSGCASAVTRQKLDAEGIEGRARYM
jgi:hypothetical protein